MSKKLLLNLKHKLLNIHFKKKCIACILFSRDSRPATCFLRLRVDKVQIWGRCFQSCTDLRGRSDGAKVGILKCKLNINRKHHFHVLLRQLWGLRPKTHFLKGAFVLSFSRNGSHRQKYGQWRQLLTFPRSVKEKWVNLCFYLLLPPLGIRGGKVFKSSPLTLRWTRAGLRSLYFCESECVCVGLVPRKAAVLASLSA